MKNGNDVDDSAKCFVETERDYYRRKQGEKAAKAAGPLLDAWASLPNDVKCDPELSQVSSRLRDLEEAMDIECWPDEEEFNAKEHLPGDEAEAGRIAGQEEDSL